MATTTKASRYSRLAPASSYVAGSLHGATASMGYALERAIASELVASGVANAWGVGPAGGHRFTLGASLPKVISQLGVRTDSRLALPDLWFMSADPGFGESLLIQIKSGGRLGKAQRAGEAASLAHTSEILARAGMPARSVLCAFDAPSDLMAIQALGNFPGISTWSGSSLCLALGIDYDRVDERWQGCGGDPAANDECLVAGLYASLENEYGAGEAARIWALGNAAATCV